MNFCFEFKENAFKCLDLTYDAGRAHLTNSHTNIHIQVSELNVVESRNSKKHKCIDRNYNDLLQSQIIAKVGCVPPYWDGVTANKCSLEALQNIG